MKTELKEKWLTALRSGEYEQGTQALKDGNQYCCLGVLCEVMNIPATYDSYDYTYQFGIGISSDCTLPSAISDSIGIRGETISALIEMNDIKGKTFKEIADYIEAFL